MLPMILPVTNTTNNYSTNAYYAIITLLLLILYLIDPALLAQSSHMDEIDSLLHGTSSNLLDGSSRLGRGSGGSLWLGIDRKTK